VVNVARRIVIAAVELAAVVLVLVAVLGWLGGGTWPIGLLEHLRLHAMVAGVVAGAAAVVARRWIAADACALAVTLDLILLAPALGGTRLVAVAPSVPLRVLLLNVHTESMAYARVAALVRDLDPDVVALVEVDRAWLDALAPALVTYPERVEHPRQDNFGLALYARRPMRGSFEDLGGALPSLVVELDGTTVILTHPPPPLRAELFEAQRRQLDAVAERARTGAGPVIVLGDLNATPWSRPFARLIACSGLADTRAGFGVQASFPAATSLLRVPIDHVLVSPGIGVRERRIEREVGSDHLPVYIELAVPAHH